MSSLWKAWVDQDVGRFQRLLAPSGYSTQSVSKSPHIGSGGGAGSPGAFGTSPRSATKPRKGSVFGSGTAGGRAAHANFGRAEVNSRDHAGLTILLRAASSTSENAVAFVQALLEHPAIDLHVQDPESGWNALHRALYAGNISIARMLLQKERKDLTGHTIGASVSRAGRLIRTKDHEGLSPFDLYNSTIAERDLGFLDDASCTDDESDGEQVGYLESSESRTPHGSEMFAFGSNKNMNLGLGDQDDRAFPERVYLQRPDHLLERFFNEYLEKTNQDGSTSGSQDLDDIPTLTRHKELLVQDVVLSKYHSAILTNDPVSNLYVCGIGRGGRLGLGDENTRFVYAPVQGGLANKRVVQVALGQNHTMAITDAGELWTWGSNAHSQLAYSLPEPANKGEDPFIATPRQVFGPLKKEVITGIAASSIHSVAHTEVALYVWGKNVGQLALMDADSRSLEVQQTPRRVAAAILSAPILMVSAIDQATTCLLANHSVIVFTAYGYNIVKFSFLDTLGNRGLGARLGEFSVSSRYDSGRNRVKHVASGGETIVALTERGDLFHMNLNQKADTNSSTSTTNPSKIKGAVSQPVCIWTAHKDGVRSVDVGEHGSVIIGTQSGAVWRRIKRAKAKDTHAAGSGDAKQKDFKFQRVPGISNIVMVRSSVFGAFAAVRKDSAVMREQIKIEPSSLWDDIAPLNCLSDFRSADSSSNKKDKLKFWDAETLQTQLGPIAYEVLKSPDLEADLHNYLVNWRYGNDDLDTAVCTSSSPDVKIPVHNWLLSARSPVLRKGLSACRRQGFFDLPDCCRLEYVEGKTILTLANVDTMSLLNLVLFMYEDRVIPAWNYARQDPSLAYRYRQVRTEVTKFAARLELPKLEAAAQKQISPERSLDNDLRSAIDDPIFFDDADATLHLDGDEAFGHSALLRQRCPFFEALFHGRSQGAWLTTRLAALPSPTSRVPIDLEHIEAETFKYVMRYLYADVGNDLFDDVVYDNLDDFSDLIMDVMSVANELMLDRLSQICQQVIARFVNTRNIAFYLNAISPCSVTAFKDAGLEYVTLQAENFLENHLLEGLDEEVIQELDTVVRDNQLSCSPFARSARAELLLHEKYPELAQDIDEERQRRVRDMAFKASQKEEERKLSSSVKGKFGSLEDLPAISPAQGSKARPGRNEPFSPDLRPKGMQSDLMFSMDEDEGPLDSPSVRPQRAMDVRKQSDMDQLTPLGTSLQDKKQKAVARSPLVSPSGYEQALPNTLGISGSLAASATATSKKPGNPWASSALPTAKLDLRDIMNEASPRSGASALSAGLAAQNANEASVSAPATKPQLPTRISQKERKRQQQLQAEQAAKAAVLIPPVRTAWEKSAESPSSSPWKVVSRDNHSSASLPKATPPARNPTETPPPEASSIATAPPPNAKPLVAAETSTKSIPRRTQSPDTRHSGQSRNAKVNPNKSTNTTRPSPKPLTTSTFSSDMDIAKPIAPHSKSYIKPASKTESTLGLSMADIIDQEKRNRDMVKEAVAKRSLQEIQQEEEELRVAQAFEEWWDRESKLAQEAERAAKEKAGTGSSSGPSRGGRRGRGGGGGSSSSGGGGKGKGGGKGPAHAAVGNGGPQSAAGGMSGAHHGESTAKPHMPLHHQQQSQHEQQHGRGRGHHRRSRGRGGGASGGPARVAS